LSAKISSHVADGQGRTKIPAGVFSRAAIFSNPNSAAHSAGSWILRPDSTGVIFIAHRLKLYTVSAHSVYNYRKLRHPDSLSFIFDNLALSLRQPIQVVHQATHLVVRRVNLALR
jgi:hypothetical protein